MASVFDTIKMNNDADRAPHDVKKKETKEERSNDNGQNARKKKMAEVTMY